MFKHHAAPVAVSQSTPDLASLKAQAIELANKAALAIIKFDADQPSRNINPFADYRSGYPESEVSAARKAAEDLGVISWYDLIDPTIRSSMKVYGAPSLSWTCG